MAWHWSVFQNDKGLEGIEGERIFYNSHIQPVVETNLKEYIEVEAVVGYSIC
jgi:hypothetical protein